MGNSKNSEDNVSSTPPKEEVSPETSSSQEFTWTDSYLLAELENKLTAFSVEQKKEIILKKFTNNKHSILKIFENEEERLSLEVAYQLIDFDYQREKRSVKQLTH